MQQIADKVGVHVTTVSRAVDDKWIQTPRGIFPLKRFFVGGTTSADGEDVAWDAIRLKLQEIVDNEDKQNPYSDDDLVKQLKKHGITVARRTSPSTARRWASPARASAATGPDASQEDGGILRWNRLMAEPSSRRRTPKRKYERNGWNYWPLSGGSKPWISRPA
jgi:hypothetical protein